MGKTLSIEQIIDAAGVVTSLTPVKDETSSQDMVDIGLEGKPYALRVLPAFVEANKVEVGKVLLKIIGCVTKEEFEEIKKEGKYHGL